MNNRSSKHANKQQEIEREERLLLRSKKDKRLSWDETFREMAREREDWSEFDATMADGLDKEPW